MKVTNIDNNSSLSVNDIVELWNYRDLVYTLSWRDLRVKYAQTLIGFIWAFITPLSILFILHFVFGKVVDVDTGSLPHILFTMVGLSVWTYFSSIVSEAGSSLINNRNLITKIYFPKLVLPISKSITGLVDYFISYLIIAVLLVFYDFVPSSSIILLPIFLILTVLVGLSIGIWISALTIRYRDFKFVVPLLLQLGLYASPVAYKTSEVPEAYQLLYHLNPLVSIIEGTRWCFTGEGQLDGYLGMTIFIIVILFVSGLLFFKKAELKIADLI